MIPKVIHYCWLSGDEYPELVCKCINSWKSILVDYEFVLWDTKKIDINSNLWLKQACDNTKYAFAADYIRFYALYHYGGIYLDADVEVLKSFDDMLNQRQFIGKEATGDIEAAVIGAEKELIWVKECLDYYQDRAFVKDDGTLDMCPVPLLINKIIAEKNIEIKPFYYFSPKDMNTGIIYKSKETYCIHYFDGKWIDKDVLYKIKKTIHIVLSFLLGRKSHNLVISYIRKIKLMY